MAIETGTRVVVVGGGYAGVVSALRLAKRGGGRLSITLVNASDRLIQRIRLHEELAGRSPRSVALEPLLRRRGVALRVGTARGLDLAGQCVDVDGTPLPWDRLIVAMGSRVDGTHVPGADEHSLGLDGGAARRGAAALRRLHESGGGRVVVVGGGLTGIESATEVAEAFPSLKVALVTGGLVAPGFSPEGREHVRRVFARMGIDLLERVRVSRVEPRTLATDGAPIGFDACVWAAGFAFPALPREAGLAVNGLGQVVVDRALRSVSHPHVFAAGDVATLPGRAVPLGCKSAQPMGALAAENVARELAGEDVRPFDYATPFYCVSLGRREGLIQMATPDGAPLGRIVTGRRAALFKEAICRSTVAALRAESAGLPAVVWKGGHALAPRAGAPPTLEGAGGRT